MIETTWHHLRGRDWSHCATLVSDAEFANALRIVGHDMNATDCLDTSHLNC